MSNKEIREFNELLNPSEDDVVLIQENGTNITKKVKTKNLLGKDSRHSMEHTASTTIISGGGLTLNGTNFDVTAGTGEFVDYWTDPEHPTFYHVEWATQLNITPITGTIAITIYIDKDGVVQQSAGTDVNNVINAGQLGIILGAIQTDGAGNALLATNGTTNYAQTPGRAISELALALGPQKISGLNVTADGGNLKMNQDGGVFYQHGGFWFEDNQDTSKKTFTADSQFYPLGIYQNGAGGFNISIMTQNGTGNDLDAGSLDDGSGTLTNYSSSKYGLFEMYENVTGTKFFIYPQKEYNSIDDAKSGIELDERVVPADIGTALLLGWIIVRGNASDLSNSSQALILNSKGAFTGSVGSGANSLQQSYDVSNDPEITIKDKVGGCFTVKDSATQTNRSCILEVKDSSNNVLLGVNNTDLTNNGTELITSGTHSVTTSALTNIATVTYTKFLYQRVGNMVKVDFFAIVTPTAIGTCSFEMDIPVASNFTNTLQAIGVVNSPNQNQNGSVTTVAANDTLKISVYAPVASTLNISASFTYEIL